MKNIVFTVLSLLLVSSTQAQTVRKTVSMGAGYAQNVWYNLETGVETKGTAFGWDLAVSMRGFDGAIQVNPFDTLYRAVNNIANFTSVSASDTLPKSATRQLFNSDTSWVLGGFNRTLTGTFDYGWGTYNQVTNNVVGDSTYLIKLANGTWKKIYIEKLSFDTSYFIKYANLDGSNPQTVEINKKTYIGKNFVYLNLSTNAILDLEPKSSDWHLTFQRYHSPVFNTATNQFEPFIVSGVLSNTVLSITRGIPSYNGSFVAKVTRKDTASDVYASTPFVTSISAIGSDWKTYDYANFRYAMSDSTTYFVKTPTNKVYKLIFKDFGGATNGNFVFSQEYMLGTSIKDPNDGVAALAVSPNPTTDGQVQIVYDLGKNIQSADFQLFDLSGKTIYAQKLPNTEGLQAMTLPYLGLNSGIYIGRIHVNGQAMIQKIVIR
ncbi:MAG: T9SS type A sorting domain-containing protein [Saprospiraceae bacterium]|nr:T9SS type A sorting domain-containing protein [Saprospiraceae bacterium]